MNLLGKIVALLSFFYLKKQKKWERQFFWANYEKSWSDSELIDTIWNSDCPNMIVTACIIGFSIKRETLIRILNMKSIRNLFWKNWIDKNFSVKFFIISSLSQKSSLLFHKYDRIICSNYEYWIQSTLKNTKYANYVNLQEIIISSDENCRATVHNYLAQNAKL